MAKSKRLGGQRSDRSIVTMDQRYDELKQSLEGLNEKFRRLEGQVQLYSPLLPSSSYPLIPSDYGRSLRDREPAAEIHILPKPVEGRIADAILPCFAPSVEAKGRILQTAFKSWMLKLNLDRCNFGVHFTGDTYSVPGKRIKKVDFSLVLKSKAVVDMYIGAVFSLLSHDGDFNGEAELGKLAIRVEPMLESWRSKVVAGLTNGIFVEWFVFEKWRSQITYRRTPIYDFRESLCAFLLAEPDCLYLKSSDISNLNVVMQLGSGKTSAVYKATHNGQEVAAKFVNKEYSFARDCELKFLRKLKGIKGIPRVIDDSHKSYFLTMPIGDSICDKRTLKNSVDILDQVVDILHAAHKKKVVHRDVRAPNILLVAGAESHMLLIDWGFATKAGGRSIFARSVRTASDKVLEQLSSCQSLSRQTGFSSESETASGSRSLNSRKRCREAVEGRLLRSQSTQQGSSCFYNEEDDLISFVKSLLMETSEHVCRELRQIPSHDYEAFQSTWARLLEERPLWAAAHSFAASRDYQKLRQWVGDVSKSFFR